MREILWLNNQKVWNELKGKHVFITGGTGFFGKSFLDLMSHYNNHYHLNLKMTILAREPEKFQLSFPDLTNKEFVFFIKGDIRDFQFIETKFDYILHFATPVNSKLQKEMPLDFYDIIDSGTKHILEFAKISQAKKFLLASSGAIYGKQPGEMTHMPENYLGAPDLKESSSTYGEAKRVAELLGNLHADKSGFEHKIARCFAFVGPYLDPHGSFAIGNFIKNAVSNQDIIINGDGTDFRSYLFSDDLVLSLLTILLFGKNKQAYNVGSDQSLSISDLAAVVLKTLNKNLKIEIKKTAIPGANPNRYVPSIELLKNDLTFSPTISIEQAIILTALYYEQQLNL